MIPIRWCSAIQQARPRSGDSSSRNRKTQQPTLCRPRKGWATRPANELLSGRSLAIVLRINRGTFVAMRTDNPLVLLLLLFGVAIYVGIILFVGWLAAKGYPRKRGRIIYLSSSPILWVIGAELMSWSQRTGPVRYIGAPVRMVPFATAVFLMAVAFGCFVAVFCYGRSQEKTETPPIDRHF